VVHVVLAKTDKNRVVAAAVQALVAAGVVTG